MSIFYADKEQLERQTGTDLIYYRHHRAGFILVQYKRCLLYTSDAADERSSVDLGGRRIIKKKKRKKTQKAHTVGQSKKNAKRHMSST